MLTIKRPIKTKVPAHTPVDVSKAVATIVNSHDPVKALKNLRATKRFVLAKLDGMPAQEAKAASGLPLSRSVHDIVSAPVGQLVIEEMLSQDRRFSDKGIVRRLRTMWDAEETVHVPVGDKVIRVKKKNWDVRKFAFTNVLELRGYKKRERDDNALQQATQIIFNVTPIPGQPPVDITPQSVQ